MDKFEKVLTVLRFLRFVVCRELVVSGWQGYKPTTNNINIISVNYLWLTANMTHTNYVLLLQVAIINRHDIIL